MEAHSICTLPALLETHLVLNFVYDTLISLVSQAGFEPATCPLGGGRAIQLRHWDVWCDLLLAVDGKSTFLLGEWQESEYRISDSRLN